MKHLLEFAKWTPNNDKASYLEFKIIFPKHFEIDDSVDAFDLIVEDVNGTRRMYNIGYDEFIEYLESTNANLSNYIKSAKLEDISHIFGDLQELGFDFKEPLQEFTNKHLTEELFNELPHDESQVSDANMRNIFGLDDDDEDGDLLEPPGDDDKY